MYKCAKMAKSCGQCLTINSTFNCGWCKNGQCSIENQCSSPKSPPWLERSKVCPDPKIIKVVFIFLSKKLILLNCTVFLRCIRYFENESFHEFE